MEYVSMAMNIAFLVFLALGFLTGFRRGFKRTLSRSVWIVAIVAILILLSMNITSLILNINVSYTYQGVPCESLTDLLMTVFYNAFAVEGADYRGLAEICVFLVSMALNGIIFVILFHLAKLVTLPFYWIANSIIFAKEKRKKREAKKRKEKIKIKKYRLAGALLGTCLGFVSFVMTFTPIIGYINLAKVVEKETGGSEGKGVLSQSIGDTYTDFMGAYDGSVPMNVLSKTGIDQLIVGVFNGLTTTSINDRKVSLTDEAVQFSKIYNEAMALSVPEFNTITKTEFNEVLVGCENLINSIFDSQFISATSDIVIPFGIKVARQSMDIKNNFKPYVAQFYNTVFDELEKLNSSNTKHEITNILGFVKTLNNNDLLLPLIQNPDTLSATYLQEHLTKDVADEIIHKLFAINTVSTMAPAMVNLLLGFGAEQLEYEYTGESIVTSTVLKQSATTILESVVDLMSGYSEESATKVEINETSITALGNMLDAVKNILTQDNFSSVINAVEPKLENFALGAMEGQPEFLQNAVKEMVGNISEVASFKNELIKVYNAIKEVETQFKDSKVDENYDVQYMDFIKIGGALDDIQSSVLFQNKLLLRTMDSAIQYFANEFEESLAASGSPIELTVVNKISSNIQALENSGIEWQSELPKYKSTLGVFLNLFQTQDSVIDKLKSDSDSTLEELGKELDGDLNSSALFNGTDRLLVSDMLNIVEAMLNPDGNQALSTLLNDAKANIADDRINVVWEDEFFHIKQLMKIELGDTNDSSLIAIGETIDKVVFAYNNGERTIPKSNIFTQDIINNFISDYMDTVFDGVTSESDFYTTINTIKTSFNTKTITSYKTEIESLLKLKEVKTLVESSGFDFNSGIPRGGIALGRKLDEALSKGGVVIDKSLINNFITLKLDDYFTSYADMNAELTQIKSKFNNSIEKYEAEFTALLRLMDIADMANEAGFDFKDKLKASNLGSSIDTALGVVTINEVGYTSKVVTRSLVNGYIKRYITDNVELDANSQFGNILTSITGTKIGQTFGEGRIDTMSNTYAREFGFLAQLLIISEEFTGITLSTIDDVNTTLNSTIAELYDGNDGTNGHAVVSDPLINSYLVGDSLLTVVDDVLETYSEDSDNEKFAEILYEVNFNYTFEGDGVRDRILWIGNTNGDLFYTDLIDAFVQIDSVLNSGLTASISQPTDFTLELAREYDSLIYELQGVDANAVGNILLQANGVNKLTKFVLNNVRAVLQTQSAIFAEEISYIDTYIDFLDANRMIDYEYMLDTKYWYLPYGSSTTEYAYIVNEEYNVWNVESDNNHSGIRINKPFEYISELING